MAQLTIHQAFDLARQNHQAGQLADAEKLYRQILAAQPGHADATHLLGVIALQVGRNDIAVNLIRQAITSKPNWPEAHSNLGHALKNLGRFDEAIAIYRQAIILGPGYAGTHCNLGNALKDNGQLDQAIAAYRQAIVLRPNYPEAFCNLGDALRESKQLDEAILACRQAITLNAGIPEAHSNLGNALQDNGQLEEAVSAYRQAIALRPNYAEALSNLGNALRGMRQLDEAIAMFRQAIAIKPGYAEAHNNLGNALKDKGDFDGAIAACRAAIALSPAYAEAHSNLGNALRAKGQVDDAIAAMRQAIALNPSLPPVYSNLGNALKDNGKLQDAIAAYRRAIELDPGYCDAYSNLGNALKDSRQLDAAIASYRQAISLNPNVSDYHSNLGEALRDMGQLDQAIAAFQRAIILDPRFPPAHNNLGNALKDAGQVDEAISAYRQAVALDPANAKMHSNLILALHYHPGHDARSIAEEHHRWNHQHAEPLAKFIPIHSNNADRNRRLRIGYVSADFRAHASAYFLVPLLEHHDPRQVELFCYAESLEADRVTHRLRQRATQWTSTVGMSDEALADKIRADRIDILVDLKMHTGLNRLLVFARKPTPVQVCWLGYPGSSGVAAIDYRLSDPYIDPPGSDESVYSEQTVLLPDSFWCYDPLDYRDIPVNPLPALQNDFVTFGCLNNLCKVNKDVLSLWAKVLGQVENSRLLLLSPIGNHRSRALELFQQHGIDPGRINFVANQSRQKYLESYHRIDLGLDTFPYNGHTTSLDSFWMGVPVVGLVGKTAVGRGGLSILSNAGLPELAARSEEDYARIAVDLANDLPRLGNLRSTLRQRMEQSPLMDAPRFSRGIEAAYRRMWHIWCEKTLLQN